MSDKLPETLDEMLGEGAMEAFNEAHNLKDDKVFITTNTLDVDGETRTFPPGVGRWIVVTVHWEHGQQIDYFRKGEVWLGVGLCMETDTTVEQQLMQMGGLIESEADTPWISWCRNWGIDNVYARMPDDMVPPFEIMGFEREEYDDHSSTMVASTAYDSKLSQWARWIRSGFENDLKPDWIE